MEKIGSANHQIQCKKLGLAWYNNVSSVHITGALQRLLIEAVEKEPFGLINNQPKQILIPIRNQESVQYISTLIKLFPLSSKEYDINHTAKKYYKSTMSTSMAPFS